MADSLGVGGVAKLRSGGPHMTIKAVKGEEPVEFTCTWFQDGEYKEADFFESVLQGIYAPVDPPKDKKVKDATLSITDKKVLS